MPLLTANPVPGHGSNGLIIPRGLWYESKLNQTLGGSDPRTANPALTKMTVQANQFAVSGTLTLDAYLNARPVQEVLSGNVTLEEAQWFVDQLRLNRTGKTTAFLLDVTDEFYTMGFVGAVIALSPNATVDNSLNHTVTPPPPPPWQALWNAIAAVASVVWNAAVAVAQFFVNLVKFLVNIVVGLVIGLATGNWNYFVDNVVKPFVEAMAAFIKFVVDLIIAGVSWLFSPLIDAFNDMIRQLNSAAMYAIDPPPLTAVLSGFISAVFLSAFGILLIAAFVALSIIMKWTEAIGIGKVLGIVIGVITSLFVAVQIVTMIFNDELSSMIPTGFDGYVDWAFTLSSFVIAASLAIAAGLRLWKTVDETVANLFSVCLSLILLSAAAGAKAVGESRLSLQIAVLLDAFALGLAFFGESLGLGYSLNPNIGAGKQYSLLTPLVKALDLAAKFMSVSSLVADVNKLWRISGP